MQSSRLGRRNLYRTIQDYWVYQVTEHSVSTVPVRSDEGARYEHAAGAESVGRQSLVRAIYIYPK
jgi:hypothetical protein